jgi:amidohydrolase
MSQVETLKKSVAAAVSARQETLIELADTLHANPEIAFEEYESAALLSQVLEEHGFALERGVAGLDTAFMATLEGQGSGPTVALLAEYDALPGLGHACGHNLIAGAAIGAGLAMQTVMPKLAGTLQVIGTPAEEGGGGKGIMVDRGVFDRVDAAMMFHPSHQTKIGCRSLASYKVFIEFHGKPAHAGARPDEGINALEALILTYNGINALRQHLRDDARVHGVITHGGDAPNIVPKYAAARFYVRAADSGYCTEVFEKVRACAEGAALATGSRLSFTEYAPRYDAMMPNPVLAAIIEANMAALGLEVAAPDPDQRMGSTDMGNVSQVVPAEHPYISIGPEEIGGHTAEFEQAAGSAAGHEGMIKAAKMLAMTAVDLLAEPENLEQARQAFAKQKRAKAG